MVPTKYKIHQLSARAVMGYAKETAQGIYSFQLTHAATEKCKASTQVDQDDNALFYQIMDELHGGSFILPADGKVVIDLSEILIYLDFAGIFDRTGIQKKYIDRQKKAECMFRPEGITLDFGSGPYRYLAFERSASMSRRAMLSFIREDFYEPIRRRIMMDLTIRQCQLSKLYAYNGLLMSSGIRVDGIGIDRPNRVIVIDNPTFKNCNVRVITVEDDGTTGSMRKYHRAEKRVDELVTVCFDGEGLISKQYAEVLNKALGPKRKHTSFQIRMPYVKGMLHQVDFKDLLMNAGTMMITDMWGVKHSVEDVEIILTKSMLKGALWLKENGKSWDDYWTAFHKYHHALYITNVSKPKPESQTELNFQFLNTLSISAEEFPELVDANGAGWFYRHVHSVAQFVLDHPDAVRKGYTKYAEAIQSKFDNMWRDKVLQFQTPIFSLRIKGAWTLRFDDILADALEQGSLKNYEVTIPDKLRQRVEKLSGKKATPYVCDLIAYYHAHRTEVCDWVILPVTSFDMYYGGSYFSKRILSTIPEKILERQNHTGTCRYRITDAFRL